MSEVSELSQLRAVFLDYVAAQSESMQTVLKAALKLAEDYYPDSARTYVAHESVLPHMLAAAQIVSQLDVLPDAVAATLLTDMPKHVPNWREVVGEQCGQNIVTLVAGIAEVQKLTHFSVRLDKSATPEEQAQQAETMRKMLLAMVEDIRVVLIKLALRTRTLHYFSRTPDSPYKREIAKETLDIFAPLANRLGVWQLKWQLEDLGFRHYLPEKYHEIAHLLDEKRQERLDYIEHFVKTLKTAVFQAGVKCDVAGRPKHIYSIYKKMVRKNLDFDGLYDIRAVRVLVNTLSECYTTLGIVHSLWQPIPGEFDDYIANPKGNGYKSLHTVIVGPENKGIEVQIRTHEMHEFNEFGVAAHWRYKEGGEGDAVYEQKIAWLRQLLDWRENMAETDEDNLSSAFKNELFNDTIYVLTPHGKVISLPTGSTPIDFAYALHSNLGDRCRGAKVNGQIVPLSTPLENGQRVEIIAAKEGEPSVSWLSDGWVKSNKAISKIRAYIRAQNTESIREQGEHQFEKLIAKIQPRPNVHKLCDTLNFKNLDDLYIAIGKGELSLRAIQKAAGSLMEQMPTPASEKSIVKRSKIKAGNQNGILVDGEEGLFTTLAKCCKPAPPDLIIGFVTRTNGISIHRQNCLDFLHLANRAPEKVLSAQWADTDDQIFAIDIEVQAQDRSGLLRDISDCLARHRVNVTAVHTQTRDLEASMRFTLEVRQVNELPHMLATLMEIKGVNSVARI